MDCLQLPFIRVEEKVSWTLRFLKRKIWPKNWSLFMTNKFESKCLQKFWECYVRKTMSYLEQPSRHFYQHFTRRTTQKTFLGIKLYFSAQARKQFKLLTVPFKPLRCCLRSDKLVNCHVWKFYKDLFLNCRVSSWPDLSIKSYFLMISSLILLRSLRVYILKQFFFSISVNSGFRNIYLAASRLRKF